MLAAASPMRPRAASPPVSRRPVRIWLWLPLTPFFWLLSPLALIFAPIVWLGTPRRTRNPWTWAIAIGRILVSLGGVRIDIDAPGARLFIHIL